VTEKKTDKHFRVIKNEREESVIQFKAVCILSPSVREKNELRDLLARSNNLRLNLSNTEDMTSKWLRFFQLLTEDAERLGKEVILFNVPNYLNKNIKHMGLNKVLKVK
jgi:hypothetical protein